MGFSAFDDFGIVAVQIEVLIKIIAVLAFHNGLVPVRVHIAGFIRGDNEISVFKRIKAENLSAVKYVFGVEVFRIVIEFHFLLP